MLRKSRVSEGGRSEGHAMTARGWVKVRKVSAEAGDSAVGSKGQRVTKGARRAWNSKEKHFEG